MKKVQRSAFSFKLSPIAASIVIAMTSADVANAGSGWGAGVYSGAPGVTAPVATYYANSPSGSVVALDASGRVTVDSTTNLPVKVDSGKALRKFVDTLPGIPGITTIYNTKTNPDQANNLGQYIPVAVPEHNWVNPATGVATTDDYYEIAAVEFTEQMHSDLPKPTRLRGYVQLSTPNNPGKHIALQYPNGSPILDASGNQVFAYDNPHHLGPIIEANSGTAVRIKFTNYLPVGGNLFLPVDKTLPGAGLGPDGKTYYTENRAEIHLVGGEAPWVSAGSPHQWVAPAGETAAYAAGMGKGASAQNVPDMADPGAGSTTLYFPNKQSARFMFYQDRTSGLTRLNSYAGLEAGYLVTDPTEASLVASGAIPADQIPLIIEDKTFVPENIAQQDAKWDTTHWGQPGDLWFPHVYETNQDPNAVNGINPVGRWDFGPWFWPIFPATTALPSGEYGNASFTPEAYEDTPLVNGTAYPTVTVSPKAYRFRILNASNDRFLNLGLYLADSTVKAPQLDRNGNPIYNAAGAQQFFTNTEVKMVPAVADTNGNPLVPSSSVGLPYDPNCLCQYPHLPQLQPTIQFSGPTRAWPTDNRVGGAPDPASVGPDFIAIGTDGGFLPDPVDIPSQPVTYEQNRRSVTVTNVYGYGLLLGPAERTDAIVDFSAYAGKTLILYNDAPAPFPFNDQREDYYTGDPDQTNIGGAYSTLPGYGPNTRTIMQIKVSNTAAAAPFNADGLLTALPAAYKAAQAAPVVPESAYNKAFGTADSDNYAHVATGSVAQPNLDFTPSANNMTVDRVDLISSGGQLLVGTTNIVGNTTPGSGTDYDPNNPPTVVFNNGSCLPAGTGISAAAHATVDKTSHQVTAVTVDNPGAGYTCAPQITFQSAVGTGAQAAVHMATTQSVLVQTKAEQELFDNAGRYNSTGGIELPLTNGNTQTTIPLSYTDSPTEFIGDSEVQLWKIVDNGFWSNSMHFDFVDVQLINRVGWDGTVKAPASNEVGWKDTLRLNPLEDVIVAMRAKRPAVPFGQPASKRLQDPSIPAGAIPNPANTSNITFLADPGVVSPTVASVNVTNGGSGYTAPVITFSGGGGSGAAATATIDANGTITGVTLTNPGTSYSAAPTVTVTDPTGSGAVLTATYGVPLLTTTTNVQATYDNEYAWNSAILGHSEDDFTRPVVYHPTVIVPDAPSGLADPAHDGHLAWVDPTPANDPATLANAKNEVGFKVNRSVNGGAFTLAATLPANSTSWTETAPPTNGDVYTYEVVAFNAAGDSQPSNTVDLNTAPAAPTGLTATANVPGNPAQVTLNWVDSATAGATYAVWRDGTLLTSLPANSTSYVDTTVVAGSTHTYQVWAVATATNGAAGSTPSAVVSVTLPIFLAQPTGLTATINLTLGTPVKLSWVDNASNETAYLVESSTDGGATWKTVTTLARLAPLSAATGGTVTYSDAFAALGNVYTYRVTAINVTGGVTTPSLPSATARADLAVPAAPTGLGVKLASATAATLTWTDASDNEASFLITSTDQNGVVTTKSVTRSAASQAATGGSVTSSMPIAAGNTYTFGVQAVLSTEASAAATATFAATVAAPANVTAVAGAPGTGVTVTWTDAPVNATGYVVLRSLLGTTGWGGYAAVSGATAIAQGVQTFTDTTVVAGRSYQYEVRANSPLGNQISAPSGVVVAQ